MAVQSMIVCKPYYIKYLVDHWLLNVTTLEDLIVGHVIINIEENIFIILKKIRRKFPSMILDTPDDSF